MTRTAAIYKVPDKTYTPLPNGFNLELADEVFNVISTRKALWDQNTWRTIRSFRDTNFLSRLRKEATMDMLAFRADLEAPVCGSVMCFAGWTNELTRADWVVDGDWIRNIKGADHSDWHYGAAEDYAEYVVVPREPDSDSIMWNKISPRLRDNLQERGFAPETHDVSNVSRAALSSLGLRQDWLSLFCGRNDLRTIRNIIDGYAQLGPSMPTVEQLRAYQWHPELCDVC